MCDMIQIENMIYFECPYCDKKYNLTRLLASKAITQRTVIFQCYSRHPNDKSDGCYKPFVIDLTLSYEIDIKAIEGEREREKKEHNE